MKILKNLNILFYSFLTVLALFLITLLVSFNANDNSFLKFNSEAQKTFNLVGPIGAFLSELLLKSLGITAYLLPLTLLVWSINFLKNKIAVTWVKISSLPFLIIFASLSLSLVTNKDDLIYPDSLNGFLGVGLSEYIFSIISTNRSVNFNSDILFTIYVLIFVVMIYLTLGLKVLTYLTMLIIPIRYLIKSINYLIFYFLGKRLQIPSLFNRSKIKSKAKTTRNIQLTKKKKLFNADYVFPTINFLELSEQNNNFDSENFKNSERDKSMLKNVLEDFNIKGTISSVKNGPVVTLYELNPAPGTKTSTVIGLSDDIARSMSSISSRISAIPGRDAIGIEIPNRKIKTVFLRELIDSEEYRNTNHILPLVLGKNILGKPVIVDLAKMPHLLVAGTTGSGKSVGINAMILSLLFHSAPEDCRLILIDPKMLELSVYQDIPHLLTEVVTDPKKAIVALKWAVKEMEKRYQLMSQLGVRDIESYNERIKLALEKGEMIEKDIQVGFDPETGNPVLEKQNLDLKTFPKIVLVVDELADLMITAGREIEAAIQRLSQMARAAGIHLIVATQRPSVDVITGTIKSNFPSRVSYQVTSKIDSRTILGEQGGEQLLGKGDLLITMVGQRLLRVHGPFVKTHEVEAVVNHLKKQGEPEYLETITQDLETADDLNLSFESNDEFYNQAVAIVCREKKASTSFLQRHLQIGYNRAARIIEKMEHDGIVSPANHVGRREVLVGKNS